MNFEVYRDYLGKYNKKVLNPVATKKTDDAEAKQIGRYFRSLDHLRNYIERTEVKFDAEVFLCSRILYNRSNDEDGDSSI